MALGAFTVDLGMVDSASLATVTGSLTSSAAFACASTLQAALGAWALRRFAAFPFVSATPLSVARFFALGGLLACGVAAPLGNLALYALGEEPASDLLLDCAIWWGGGVAGVAVFGAAVLSLQGPTPIACLRRATPVIATAIAAIAATTALVWIDVASIQRDIDFEFALLSRELATRLEATVDLGQHAIEGLAGGFALSRPHELTDFRAIADKLAAFGLGIQALEWIPPSPTTSAPPSRPRCRANGASHSAIFERRDGKPARVSPRPAYFPVAFVTPLKATKASSALTSPPTRLARRR